MRELEPGLWLFNTRDEAEAYYNEHGNGADWIIVPIATIHDAGAKIVSKDGQEVISKGFLLSDNEP